MRVVAAHEVHPHLDLRPLGAARDAGGERVLRCGDQPVGHPLAALPPAGLPRHAHDVVARRRRERRWSWERGQEEHRRALLREAAEERLELGERDVEHRAQSVHRGGPEPGELLVRAHQLPGLGVGRLEEREADEPAQRGGIDDDDRVVLVGLADLPDHHPAPLAYVVGQDAHHLIAELVEVVGEREPAVAGELDSDEDGARLRATGRLLDEAVRLVEPLARDVERQRLAVLAAVRADDEGVLELAGVDADDSDRALGAGTAL